MENRIDDISFDFSNDNFIKIDIIKPAPANKSLTWFINHLRSAIDNGKNFNIYDVNFDCVLNKMAQIYKGSLYIIKNNNRIYNIFKNQSENSESYDSFFVVDYREKNTENNKNITLELLPNNKYTFKKVINDYSAVNNSVQYFSNNEELLGYYSNDRANNSSEFASHKTETLIDIISLLEDLESIEGIDDIVSLDKIYSNLGLISKKSLNPIAIDKNIIISQNNTDKNKYDIVKVKTQELIGDFILDNHNNYKYTVNDLYKDSDISNRAFKMFRNIMSNSNNQKIYKKKKDQ